MQELFLIQGSADWHAHRAKYRNASDTPAVTGHSPHKSRSEFMKERATGIAQDIDPATQRRFDDGHRYEALARPIMEAIIGQEVFPITGTEGQYSASFDGLTMLGEIAAEHKTLNDEIRACSTAAELPIYYREQMEHQLMVSGAEKCLFIATRWDADDNLIEKVHFWYAPDLALRQQIVAAWDQFERDLAEFVPEPETVKPAGVAPEALPALRIEVTGMVTASNLAAFREHALAVFGGIKTDLQTDADFADAEKTVRWCKEVEDRLDAAKQHALSQTASIDELFRTIDAIKEEARQKRLTLDKLVKAEKENRKAEIVAAAQRAMFEHLALLNDRVGVVVPAQTNFGEAIKGLKSLDSMRDKVSTALASAKIEANAIADRIDANRKTVEDMSLMPDFAQVCTKAPDDFAALYAMRKQQRAEAEAKKLEAEREKIRREEEAKARAEAERVAQAERERIRAEEQAKAQAAQEAERLRLRAEAEAREQAMQADAAKRAADLKALADVKPGPAPQFAQPQADTGAKITLGQINQRLSPVALSVAGLAQLGIQPAGKDRAAVLYLESDVARICSVLIRHLTTVARGEIKEAA